MKPFDSKQHSFYSSLYYYFTKCSGEETHFTVDFVTHNDESKMLPRAVCSLLINCIWIFCVKKKARGNLASFFLSLSLRVIQVLVLFAPVSTTLYVGELVQTYTSTHTYRVAQLDWGISAFILELLLFLSLPLSVYNVYEAYSLFSEFSLLLLLRLSCTIFHE